jgi:deoxyribodipyrimidine photo-lyase
VYAWLLLHFLCKHLLLDWRLGEAYFAAKLLDFDLAANNGGWQWAAGSGCDAAPLFPDIQSLPANKEV